MVRVFCGLSFNKRFATSATWQFLKISSGEYWLSFRPTCIISSRPCVSKGAYGYPPWRNKPKTSSEVTVSRDNFRVVCLPVAQPNVIDLLLAFFGCYFARRFRCGVVRFFKKTCSPRPIGHLSKVPDLACHQGMLEVI